MATMEVIAGIASVLFTGGVGWWAHYVTRGASMAHKLSAEIANMQKSLIDHEQREEAKFDAVNGSVEKVQSHVERVQDQVGALIGSVSELHGKVDALTSFVIDGSPKDRG